MGPPAQPSDPRPRSTTRRRRRETSSTDAAIRELIETAPALTPELLDRIRSLLPPPPDDEGDTDRLADAA